LDEEPFVCKAFFMLPPEDGTYDVVVIEALPGPTTDVVLLELTISTGPRKGEVVRLRAAHLAPDPLCLLGLAATLTVAGGVPSLRFD